MPKTHLVVRTVPIYIICEHSTNLDILNFISGNWRRMCHDLGMPDCSQLFRTFDISTFLRHLERDLKFTVIQRQFDMEYPTLVNEFLVGSPAEFSFQRSEGYMKPVVLEDLRGSTAFVIIPTLIPPGDIISFNTVYLEGRKAQESVEYEIQYSFRNQPSELACEGNVRTQLNNNLMHLTNYLQWFIFTFFFMFSVEQG